MQVLTASINTANALFKNEIASGRFAKDVNSALDTWQSLADRNQQQFSEIWQSVQPHVFSAIRFTARISAHFTHWCVCDLPGQLQAFLTWLAATYSWFIEQIPNVEEVLTELDELDCNIWDLVDSVDPLPSVTPVQFTFATMTLMLPPAKEPIQPTKKRRGGRKTQKTPT